MPRTNRSWTPANTFRTTKLKSAGPKDGQSVRSYLYGKKLESQKWSRRLASKGWIPEEELRK